MRNTSERGVKEAVKRAMRRMQTLPAWLRRLGYYLLALLFVAAAATLRWALPEVLGSTPFLVFYLAWVGAAVFGGLGPGLLATVASWLCISVLFDPPGGLTSFHDPTTIGRLVVLLAGGLTVSLVADKMRRGRFRERRQGQELAGANAVLRESRERLRQRAEEVETLMDLIPAPIWVAHDPQCNHITGNQAANRLFEAHEQENVSANISPLRRLFRDKQELKPEELPMQVAAAKNIDIRDAEVDVLLPSGMWRNILGSASPLHDAEGRVRGCIAAFMDITARRHAEEALRESEEQLRAFLENSAVIAWLKDEDGRHVFLSQNYEKRFNVRLEDWKGKTDFELWPREVAEEFRRNDLATLASGGPREVIERASAPDGSDTWWLNNKFIFCDSSGRRYVGGLGVDITERRKAEEALREWNAMLESKVAERTAQLEHRARQLQKMTLELSLTEDRERKRLAEILHDDLQQVLAAAKFHLSIMRNQARRDPSVHDIGDQVDEMLKDAIEKTRSLSHELSPAVLHQDDLAEMLQWLANRMQAKHGLTVHVQAHDCVTLESDTTRAFLYKVTQELLFNIVKHARVNEARMRIRRWGQCICLSVSDQGRGFDPQDLKVTAGFGLFSIRERVELLGGRMKIKSAKGHGSTFHILVPNGELAKKAVAVEPAGLARETKPAQGDGQRRLRVLIADDHEIVREGLISLLSDEHSIQVVGEAANGREAVDLADRLRPDVVIMDVAMPLIDGDEATRQIKQHMPGTRVIALSMYEEHENVEKMLRAGAEAYILKTAPSEELLAVIRSRQTVEA